MKHNFFDHMLKPICPTCFQSQWGHKNWIAISYWDVLPTKNMYSLRISFFSNVLKTHLAQQGSNLALANLLNASSFLQKASRNCQAKKRKCLVSGYPTDPNILGPTQTFLKSFGIFKSYYF